MEAFKIAGDEKHLYFRNIDGMNKREKLNNVMSVLISRDCQITHRTVGNDCTLIHCKIEYYRFVVCDASKDKEEIYLCVDDDKTMEFLHKLFNSGEI